MHATDSSCRTVFITNIAGSRRKKGQRNDSVSLVFFGRGEKIRTSDPLHPMQVRYQAALRPEQTSIISVYPPMWHIFILF